jgi:hypothetical protein
MSQHDKTTPAAPNPRRRRFLFTIGTGGVAAAAAAIRPVSDATPELTTPAPSTGSGYRETDHVRDYYRTTKI